MYHIQSVEDQNLLLMKLEGCLSSEEWREGAKLVICEAKKLKKGFTIINDISKMKLASNFGEKEIMRFQSFLLKSGMGSVIRVTQPSEAQKQFQKTGNKVGYSAIEANSLDEAYELINL